VLGSRSYGSTSPIDLIQEFIPTAGPLDDAIAAALVLRHLLKRTARIRRERPTGPATDRSLSEETPVEGAAALSFLGAELKARPVTKSCLRREVDGRSGSELGVGIA